MFRPLDSPTTPRSENARPAPLTITAGAIIAEEDDWDDEDFDPDEWTTLRGAVDLLLKSGAVSYVAAKGSIVEMTADGRLEMRCAQVLEEADLGLLSWKRIGKLKRHPQQAEQGFKLSSGKGWDPMPLASDFWGRSDGWSIDPNRIDVEVSTIVGTRPTTFLKAAPDGSSAALTRRAAKGLLIKTSSIFAADHPKSKRSKEERSKHGKVGPRNKKFSWAIVLASLETEIDNGMIEDRGKITDYGMQARIEDFLGDEIERIDGRRPGESTLRRKAVKLMDLWKQKIAG